nr:redoxin domain-containing protein [Bacillus thuringiensis]
MITVGEMAPEFTLEGSNGEEVCLADFRGKNVVLYFYPKDMTPGCTTEACDFRDAYGVFQEKDTVILGVSLSAKNSAKINCA